MDRILRIISRAISAITYPLLMPTYAILLAFKATILNYLPGNPVVPVTMVTFGITVAVPVIAIYLLSLFKVIGDPLLNERRDRTIPFMVTIASYTGLGIYLSYLHAPAWLTAFTFASAVLLFIMALINLKWKISGHAAGMGGLTALAVFLVYRGYCLVPGTTLPCILVLASGCVCTARLLLGRHTLGQVGAGYLLSVALLYSALIFFGHS